MCKFVHVHAYALILDGGLKKGLNYFDLEVLACTNIKSGLLDDAFLI